MASACVNSIGMSPGCPPSKRQSYGLLSPRISTSREILDDAQSSKASCAKHSSSPPPAVDKCGDNKQEESDPEVLGKDVGDFEFRLDRPEIVLPADELFSDGKLLPLQPPTNRLAATSTAEPVCMEVRLRHTPKLKMRDEISSSEPFIFSPLASRCSSRRKELLGLKKLYQNSNAKHDSLKTTLPLSLSSPSQNNSSHKSMKKFLQRSPKSLDSSVDASLSFPLLKDFDNESVSISSRLSIPSSSGHENDDLPRLSLDAEKPTGLCRNTTQNINPHRFRSVKPRALSSENSAGAAAILGRGPVRRASDAVASGVSMDSPRMNSSGKIVFPSLGRSSSSPSSFNGEPRYKHRGVQRSHSANVRVTPVLNVPVCSLRGSSKSGVFGFPLFSSSQQKKEAAGSSNGGNRAGNKNHQGSSRHRTVHRIRVKIPNFSKK